MINRPMGNGNGLQSQLRTMRLEFYVRRVLHEMGSRIVAADSARYYKPRLLFRKSVRLNWRACW